MTRNRAGRPAAAGTGIVLVVAVTAACASQPATTGTAPGARPLAATANLGGTATATAPTTGDTPFTLATPAAPAVPPIPWTMPAAPAGTDPDSVAAKQEADRILAGFAAPPGAVPSAAAPTSAPAVLAGPPQFQVGPEYVAETAWYVTAQSPADVLAWVDAHPPAGSPGTHGDGSGSNTPTFQTFGFQQPAIPETVLSARELVVSTATGADGKTVIRLDAEVTWFPARPAGEHVPTDAASVTVTASNTMNPTLVHLPQPVTVTDPAELAKIFALFDALPVRNHLAGSCADDAGTRVTLDFRSSGGQDVARVVATAGGCGEVAVTVRGQGYPELTGARNGFAQAVYQALGVSFTPPF